MNFVVTHTVIFFVTRKHSVRVGDWLAELAIIANKWKPNEWHLSWWVDEGLCFHYFREIIFDD